MPLPEINHCPSTLRPGFITYSPAAQANLFGSRARKVSHILPFGPPGKNNELTRKYNEKRKNISISGVQEKYSIKQDKDSLVLTDTGGTHILKPVPVERLERVEDLPANEHVSMQIAKQVFSIKTAECGMIFFDDGATAYLTRRFDYKPDGTGKYQLEDFATLLGRSPEREGENFKYNASYLDIASMIKEYAVAAPVVLLEFFTLLVFNYFIANGDAHLKNFSLRKPYKEILSFLLPMTLFVQSCTLTTTTWRCMEDSMIRIMTRKATMMPECIQVHLLWYLQKRRG
jgi:serine/threonine-protein kinase HipA